jgi:hypothetical protein
MESERFKASSPPLGSLDCYSKYQKGNNTPVGTLDLFDKRIVALEKRKE